MPPRKNVCGLDGNGTSASSAAASVNTAFRSGGQASWTGDKGGRSGSTRRTKMLHQSYAAQLLAQNHLLGGVYPVKLEKMFRRVHPNSANLFHGRSPLSEISNDLILACAVERRRFPVGASPTRQPLQSEAIGA